MLSVPLAVTVAAGTLLLVLSLLGVFVLIRRWLLADEDLVAFVERVEEARSRESSDPAEEPSPHPEH